MAEPTITRAEIRRTIAREMRMPFSRRQDYLSADAASSVSELIDTDLTQESGYWENQYIYVPTTGDVRLIVTHDGGRTALIPEYNFSATTLDTNGNYVYEIHRTFSADDIHQAINDAIEDGFPSFFDVVVDETMVLCEDTLEYALTSLSTTPWLMRKIWVEVIDNGSNGTAAAGAATSITLSSSFSSTDMVTNPTNYRISIYDGTSKGDVRTPSAYNNTTKIATVSAWTATPTTTSKYRVWDATSQSSDWKRLLAVKFDQKEWPTKMYLKRRYSGLNGGRLRLQYLAKPAQLTTEVGTTLIPERYIVSKAMSSLFETMANSNRFNRQRYADLATRHGQLAETYRNMKAFDRPDGSLWQEDDHYGDGEGGALTDPGDPMGWWG